MGPGGARVRREGGVAPVRIDAVRVATLRRTYDGSQRNTRHAWDAKHYVLVEIVAGGLSGLGEMYCDGGGTPAVAEALLRHEIAPHILGQDARQVGAIVHALRGWPTPFAAAVNTQQTRFDAEGRIGDATVEGQLRLVGQQIARFAPLAGTIRASN